MYVFFAHMFAEQNKIQSGNARLTSSNAPPGTSASRTSTGATAIRIVQITATRTALRPLTTLHTPLRLPPVRSFFNVSIASFIIHSCNLSSGVFHCFDLFNFESFINDRNLQTTLSYQLNRIKNFVKIITK